MKKKFLLILIVLLAILAGILLVKTNQDVREKAVGVGGEIRFSSEKKGETYRVDVLFKTTSQTPLNISTIALKLVSSEAKDKSVEVVDERGIPSNVIFVDEQVSQSGWSFPVNKVKRFTDKIEIELMAAYLKPQGFSTPNFTKIASFYLKPGNGNTVSFSVDNRATAIYTKDKPVKNILSEGLLENFIVILEE